MTEQADRVLDAGSPADRLADAAITVIARDGFDALSVRGVAREASVTGGTVQHHFPTKAELVAAALDRTVRRQGIRMTIASAGIVDPVERVIAGLGALVPRDRAGRDEVVVWVAMSAAVGGSELVAERHGRAVEALHIWLSAQLDEAVANGAIAAGLDLTETVPMLEAALDGVTLQAVAEQQTDTVASALTARLAGLVRAILARPR